MSAHDATPGRRDWWGLAVLATSLPSALNGAGIGGPAADGMVDAVRQSAGGALAALRDSGAANPFGPGAPAVVDALTAGFADATRWAALAAGAFLLLGFLGALRVRVAAGREVPAEEGPATPSGGAVPA
ncbi:hypothetical protein [Corynebacterium sp. 335C]